jgi:hypothetical protein
VCIDSNVNKSIMNHNGTQKYCIMFTKIQTFHSLSCQILFLRPSIGNLCKVLIRTPFALRADSHLRRILIHSKSQKPAASNAHLTRSEADMSVASLQTTLLICSCRVHTYVRTETKTDLTASCVKTGWTELCRATRHDQWYIDRNKKARTFLPSCFIASRYVGQQMGELQHPDPKGSILFLRPHSCSGDRSGSVSATRSLPTHDTHVHPDIYKTQ